MPTRPFQSGQISFDFIITLLMALIVLQSSIVVLRNVEVTQNEIQIRDQETYIALKVNQAVELSKTIDLSNGAQAIVYQIPKISVIGFVGKMELDANVSVGHGRINVTTVEPVSNKTVKREFEIGNILTGFTKKSGETFTCIRANTPADCT